ncbi:winged helix-turn-helix domain-containing protein [Herbidospora cretacea]|uniref:winged helix-turn-helix domain-containing protein n=1 Tax=Herbidospora cretacea TaxID=28444 RepID=UPI000773FAFA|nr:winged helix-turn-helix domain-containing protein [Herbidospora cretacea]
MSERDHQEEPEVRFYDDVPKYRTLVDHFRKLIADGVLVPGDRLPGEPAMAARFGIARRTARRVLDELLESGEAYAVIGLGTYVSDPETGGAPKRD